MTPRVIAALLLSPITAFIGRLLLVFAFLGSGISKAIDFPAATAEMEHFGLDPPWLFALLTLVTQIVGSVLILFNRATWLGAGALAVFTLLTIPIAHHFWALSGERAQVEFYFAMEHLSIVGGMILAAALAVRAERG